MSTPLALVPLLGLHTSPLRQELAIPYGMTMWFQVDVHDVGIGSRSLGRWSACSSLTMKVKTEPVPDGAHPAQPAIAPVAVEYPNITLKRAVSAADSLMLRNWLERVIRDWVIADEGATPASATSATAAPAAGALTRATPAGRSGYAGTTVRIRLFSAAEARGVLGGNEITAWELHNAYPVEWSGPALDAKSGDVAIETLTLAHSGFLRPRDTPRSGAHRAASGSGPGSGRLQLSHAGEVLELQFQPVDVKMTKNVTVKPTPGIQFVSSDQITDPGKLKFDFTVRVEGVAAVERARTLLYSWLEPLPLAPNAWKSARPQPPGPRRTSGNAFDTPKPVQAGRPAPAAGAEVSQMEAKKLTLRIGVGRGALEYEVTLHSINATFPRFSAGGVPSRATIALSANEFKEEPRPTNPTSGGPPGTTVHTVIAGDSLAHIALDAYASPARWREIAEGNGIDDPFRLRNGTMLLLPGSRAR